MKFGIGIATCREGWDVPPGFGTAHDLIKVSQNAEKLGLDFVWGSDFISLLPDHQKRLPRVPNWYEILISLAAISTATKKIGLGLGVMIMSFREPVILAKQLATLDVFSGGRVMFGVGQGSVKAEFEHVAPRNSKYHRGRMLEEHLEALRLLFTQDQATFKGKYYEFDAVTLYPRPVQQPFPVYVSGHTDDTLIRTVKWGKGLVAGSGAVDKVREKIEKLRKHAQDAGRDPSTLDVMTSGVLCLAKTHEDAMKKFPERYAGKRFLTAYPGSTPESLASSHFVGTPSEVAERIKKLAAVGVTHCIGQHVAAQDVAEFEEQMRMFAEEVVPAVKRG